jgi:hypothetical protein
VDAFEVALLDLKKLQVANRFFVYSRFNAFMSQCDESHRIATYDEPANAPPLMGAYNYLD